MNNVLLSLCVELKKVYKNQLITSKHDIRRVGFIRNNTRDNWENTLFVDECTICSH